MRRFGDGNSQTMCLSGAISIRRLLRRSAITIGYGSGPSQAFVGASREPVTGGGAGSETPLDTTPAPLISGVTTTGWPSDFARPADRTAPEKPDAQASKASVTRR